MSIVCQKAGCSRYNGCCDLERIRSAKILLGSKACRNFRDLRRYRQCLDMLGVEENSPIVIGQLSVSSAQWVDQGKRPVNTVFH